MAECALSMRCFVAAFYSCPTSPSLCESTFPTACMHVGAIVLLIGVLGLRRRLEWCTCVLCTCIEFAFNCQLFATPHHFCSQIKLFLSTMNLLKLPLQVRVSTCIYLRLIHILRLPIQFVTPPICNITSIIDALFRTDKKFLLCTR